MSKVLYDVQETGRRYMSNQDMRFEAKLLGLAPSATMNDIARELKRRGLYDYSMGRAMKGAKA
jgi:hypothetical protein